MEEQMSVFEDNPEYQTFVDKFKPQKTTDDCYTPPIIYEAIKSWACEEFGIDSKQIVRPFYPGGDYEHFTYPEGCTVLDNPPFSILTQICEFFLDRGISFFLFAPALTCLSGKNTVMRMNHILPDAEITYENGAVVRTAFVTSYGGDVIVQSAPSLYKAINEANAKLNIGKKERPKYQYPDHIVTAAMVQKYSKYGIDYVAKRSQCQFVSKLDSQIRNKKTIFGCGLLLSDAAAAEKAAAEKAAAEKAAADIWELSDREKRIIARLGG